MLPERITISNALRDRLSAALTPFHQDLPGQILIQMMDSPSTRNHKISLPDGLEINGHNGNTTPLEIVKAAAPRVAEALSNALFSIQEGKDFFYKILNIHKGTWDVPAVLFENLPANGVGAYLLLGLSELLGQNQNKGDPCPLSFIVGDGGQFFENQPLHQDRYVKTPSRSLMMHGFREGKNICPTLFAYPDEVLEAMVDIWLNDHHRHKVSTALRMKTRAEIIELLEAPQYVYSYGVHTEKSVRSGETHAQPCFRMKYSAGNDRLLPMLIPPTGVEKEADKKYHQAFSLLQKALNRLEKYEGVVLKPDQLVVLDNQYLLHCRGPEVAFEEVSEPRFMFRLTSSKKNIHSLMPKEGEPSRKILTDNYTHQCLRYLYAQREINVW